MTRYFLGIDTGSTKSHALIADEHGRCLSFAQSGPGNWEGIGWERTRAMLDDLVGTAVHQAGLTRAQITAAGLGLAGYDWPEDEPPHRALADALLPGVPAALANDALIGLLAGATEGWGVAVAAGTSCNCYGRHHDGRIGRVGGFGTRFGEHAGAIELVQATLRAIVRDWSRRGPATRLTPAFVALVGARDADDLLAGLTRGRYAFAAAHAPVVFATAAAGDAVATDLIRWAGRELGDMACGVIRQLDLAGEPLEVVLSGSFYNGSPLVAAELAATVQATAPQAKIVRLAAPPVVGGVLLGMELAGLATAVRRPLVLQTVTGFTG